MLLEHIPKYLLKMQQQNLGIQMKLLKPGSVFLLISGQNLGTLLKILLLNLYGHPIAGLLWGKYQESKLFKLGFEKVPSWECLYVHYDKKLFLSAYVDDYKMAGRETNIGPMWAAMKAEGLDLEPSVPLCKNVYHGCGQKEVQPDRALINEKLETFRRICFRRTIGESRG